MGAYQAGRWPLKDETGNRYGSWEVLGQAQSWNGARWRCRCTECGAERILYGYALRAGVAAVCRHQANETEG